MNFVPVDDVGEEVVMLELVVRRDLLVVDRKSPRTNTPFILLGRVSSELPGEHVQDTLPDPPTLREGREGEVVRIHFAQTLKIKKKQTTTISIHLGAYISRNYHSLRQRERDKGMMKDSTCPRD